MDFSSLRRVGASRGLLCHGAHADSAHRSGRSVRDDGTARTPDSDAILSRDFTLFSAACAVLWRSGFF